MQWLQGPSWERGPGRRPLGKVAQGTGSSPHFRGLGLGPCAPSHSRGASVSSSVKGAHHRACGRGCFWGDEAESWGGTWLAVTGGSYCCCSFLPICRQEGRKVGLRPVPIRVHQSPPSRIADPAKQTCRPGAGPEGAGSGRACPGLGWDPRGGGPAGRPAWPRVESRPDAGAILVFLGFSSAAGSGPCPPPGAGGLCSLAPVPEGGCQEGAARGSPRASSESSREACRLPGGAGLGPSWCRSPGGAGPSARAPSPPAR